MEEYKRLVKIFDIAGEILDLSLEKNWSPSELIFAMQMLMVTKDRII